MRPALLALALLSGCARCAPPPARPGPRRPHFDAHLHISHGAALLALALMDREGVVGGVNLSGGAAGRGLEESLDEAEQVGHGRLVVFANIDASGLGEPGWTEREVANLRRAHELGARGLKVFKQLGLKVQDSEGRRVPIDDARLAPIFEAAGELGMPVAVHAGDPKAFFQPDSPQNERHAELALHPEWSFAGPGWPSWEQVFAEFERLVAAHPRTTFIGVHFGNDPEEPFRVGELLDRHPNLLIDTAARLGEIGRADPERLRALFVRHRKRILFGTDWGIGPQGVTLGAGNGWREGLADVDLFFARHDRFFETRDRQIDHPTPIQGAWKIDAIGLPDDVLDDLYLGNAERLLGWKPPPQEVAHAAK